MEQNTLFYVPETPTVESSPEPPRRRLFLPMFLAALLGSALTLGGAIAYDRITAEDEVIAETTATSTQAAAPILTTTGASTDPVSVGEAVVPSVVTVEIVSGTGTRATVVGSGSGVIIDTEGHIVTNDHVASAGSAVRVILADGRIYDASVIDSDPLTDLAVLDIEANGLIPVQFGSTDGLSVGDTAIAVGSPLGLEGGPSLTVGVVSAFGRQVGTSSTVLYGMLQTDAPITQGSSGGALVNGNGRLIGITTAVGVSQVGVEGIGFATPIEIVQRVVDDVLTTGRVANALLGITGSTDFIEAADGATRPTGVAVQEVQTGTAAASGGLEPGDIITSVDGASIDTMDELVALLRRHSVGDTIDLTIERGAQQQIVSVVLGER